MSHDNDAPRRRRDESPRFDGENEPITASPEKRAMRQGRTVTVDVDFSQYSESKTTERTKRPYNRKLKPETITPELLVEQDTPKAEPESPAVAKVTKTDDAPRYVPALWQNPALLDTPKAEALLDAMGHAAIQFGYADKINEKNRLTLTAPMLQAICHGIEKGISEASICDHLGIPPTTFQNWKVSGKSNKNPICYALVQGIQAARARFEITLLDRIQEVAQGRAKKKEIRVRYERVWNEQTQSFEMQEKDKAEIIKEDGISFEAARFLLERRLKNRWGELSQSDEDDEVASVRLDDELDSIEFLTVGTGEEAADVADDTPAPKKRGRPRKRVVEE